MIPEGKDNPMGPSFRELRSTALNGHLDGIELIVKPTKEQGRFMCFQKVMILNTGYRIEGISYISKWKSSVIL